MHIHLTLTGTLPFFALFVTESLARDCLIVEGDAFAQHGIAFSFSTPMDRHIPVSYTHLRYEATRSHSYTSGDYEITKTEHFDIYRAGSVTFEKVPVDASSKMPDDHMDSIEPYDYKGLKSFSTAYLPGFLADKYDVSVERAASVRISAARARWTPRCAAA